MCGIFGILNQTQASPAQLASELETGIQAIKHRGPDGKGTWQSENAEIGLGHVRLSIIDLDSGAQPICSTNNRYTLTYNGEVYNFLELRERLGPSTFRTSSDTEVVLRAFEEWGVDCVNHFRGMFAFAIWDSHKKELFLARDRFGIKPLYWSKTKKGVVFGSEIKALLPFLDTRAPNQNALKDYFAFQFCLGSKTLSDGVHQLPPAHYAVLKAGEAPHVQRYWEVQFEIDYHHTEKWFSERLKELLDDSIKLHMRSDVEVGAYVSGGVDSSLLALLGRGQVPDAPFKAFNGRFVDDGNFDESQYARALAEKHDMEFHLSTITESDFVENIENVIWHMDQPNAGPGSFPQYMVSKNVSEHVKVVLGGQGGDEIFGGYARYLVAYFEQCIKGALEGTLNDGNFVVTYDSIIPNLRTLEQYKPMLREFWSNGVFGPRDERYWRLVNRSNTFGEVIASDLINQPETLEEFKSIFWGDNVSKESYFDSMTHFDFKTLLPALLQVEDRMSMAHGVEARVPFLDHPLIEFAATIPADIKFKNGELKRLLKLVFSQQLPTEIVNRKDKMGFPVPLNQWLKNGGAARDLIGDIFSSKKAQSRSYLARGFDLDDVLSGQSAFGRNLWALLSLEIWHQKFIDQ